MKMHGRGTFYWKLDFERKCVLTRHCNSLGKIEESNTIVDDILFLSMMNRSCSSDCSFANSMTLCSSFNPMNFLFTFDKNIESLRRKGLIKRDVNITGHILSRVAKSLI